MHFSALVYVGHQCPAIRFICPLRILQVMSESTYYEQYLYIYRERGPSYLGALTWTACGAKYPSRRMFIAWHYSALVRCDVGPEIIRNMLSCKFSYRPSQHHIQCWISWLEVCLYVAVAAFVFLGQTRLTWRAIQAISTCFSIHA